MLRKDILVLADEHGKNYQSNGLTLSVPSGPLNTLISQTTAVNAELTSPDAVVTLVTANALENNPEHTATMNMVAEKMALKVTANMEFIKDVVVPEVQHMTTEVNRVIEAVEADFQDKSVRVIQHNIHPLSARYLLNPVTVGTSGDPRFSLPIIGAIDRAFFQKLNDVEYLKEANSFLDDSPEILDSLRLMLPHGTISSESVKHALSMATTAFDKLKVVTVLNLIFDVLLSEYEDVMHDYPGDNLNGNQLAIRTFVSKYLHQFNGMAEMHDKSTYILATNGKDTVHVVEKQHITFMKEGGSLKALYGRVYADDKVNGLDEVLANLVRYITVESRTAMMKRSAYKNVVISHVREKLVEVIAESLKLKLGDEEYPYIAAIPENVDQLAAAFLATLDNDAISTSHILAKAIVCNVIFANSNAGLILNEMEVIQESSEEERYVEEVAFLAAMFILTDQICNEIEVTENTQTAKRLNAMA